MGKRLVLSVGMLAAGAALLVVSAYGAPARNGGIFKLAVVGPGDTLDPQIAYNTLTWSLEYATAAKLLNFPDRRGVGGSLPALEVAKRYTVSKDGRVYTFWIRKGFRFSDGSRVTARNFAYAFDRVLSPNLQSPGRSFITDPAGVHVTSYHAAGQRFVVHLAHPSSAYLLVMTMPFFQATSKELPLEPVTTGPIPSAGPYYIASHDPNTQTVIRRNRYYRGTRPHHMTGVIAFYNQNIETAWQDIDHHFDEKPIPPDQIQTVASRFGVNQSRFWVKPTPCQSWIAINDKNGLFRRNAAMRKAFNWALDRKAYNAAAAPYSRTTWTQILVPGMPGVITKRKLQPFTPGPNLKKARRLAAGHFRGGKITVFYRSSGITAPRQKDVVVRALRRMGFKMSNIRLVGFQGVDIYDALERRTDWDLGLSIGWCQEYPFGFDFMKNLLKSFPGFSLPSKYAEKLQAIEELKEPARSRAFGRLGLSLMRNVAPVAPTSLYNNLYFFSNRVAPKSLVYQSIYSDWDFAALRLK